MFGRTDSKGRMLLLFIALVILCGGMTARLAYWQINQHERLTTQSAADTSQRQSVPALRGTIYDRTGKVVLAETVQRYRLVADLHSLTPSERQRDGDALKDYLSLSGDTESAMRKKLGETGYYVPLATNVDATVAAEIRAYQALGGLATVTLELTPVRVYPQAGGAPHTSLAAQLLGFVNAAGRGQYGIEQEYDTILAGKPEVDQVDPSTSGPPKITVIDPGTPGQDIRTTIDAGLQLHLEQEVFAAWIADRATTVSAAVMDPKTGSLMAEASYPSYDANEFSVVAAQDPSLFMDPVVSEVYEPGSVFKMLTASAALQSKTVTLTTQINDYGVMTLPGGQVVADADRKAKGIMTFQDIVAWSRNVGVSQVAFHLGKTTNAASAVLYDTWQTYGIGEKTGIDLAGEVSGIVPDPSVTAWQQIDLANRSFGQGVAVTPIQVLRAYAVMANGGRAVQPHVTQFAASATASPTAAPKQLISASLAGSLTGLMQHVVTAVPSYNQATYIPGYFVGGKTGTAQIWDTNLDKGKGGWLPDVYNYSFYGWVGHSSPDLTIGVVVYHGALADMPIQSTELFRRVATDSVLDLHIAANKDGPAPPPGQRAKSLG